MDRRIGMAESDAKHQIDHEHYPDSYIRDILSSVRTIAVVGASQKWNRPSYFMAKYLQSKGYRIVPVNPGLVDQEILGEHVYASLKDIPFKIDMVDIFRNSEAAGPIAEEAVEIGADVVWMQLGVRNDKAAETAEKAGLKVVMNRCPKIEFSRLYGELSWHGFDSNVISSKRRAVGTPSADKAANPMASPRQPAGFETRAIHPRASPDPTTGARSAPIYQTTAYVFEDADHAASLFNLQTFGNIYARLSNPTTAVLEERIASLEGGRGTTCTASGHSAQMLALFR